VAALIRKEPLAQIDYVSIADAGTLEELALVDRPAVASLAVKIGKTRLIDNMPLG
jgi:pantoate--beta-alanine ligase